MKRVCAWCEAVMEQDDHSGMPGTSHGICHPCSVLFDAAEVEISLSDIIEELMVPVVLVRGDHALVGANRAALSVFAESLGALRGLRLGDAVQCRNAREPEGCGRTLHCSGCTIRRVLQYTMHTGVLCYAVAAHVPFETATSERLKAYSIASRKVGSVLALRIDETQITQPQEQIPVTPQASSLDR